MAAENETRLTAEVESDARAWAKGPAGEIWYLNPLLAELDATRAECETRRKEQAALVTRIHDPVIGYEARIAALTAERDALADGLRKLLNDKNLIQMMADYNKGHLSHAGSLNSKLGPMYAALAAVHAKPETTPPPG